MADLGFPRGGGANSPGGAPTYDFAKFSQKLHEIERIWAPRGGARPKFYYVDPPLILVLLQFWCPPTSRESLDPPLRNNSVRGTTHKFIANAIHVLFNNISGCVCSMASSGRSRIAPRYGRQPTLGRQHTILPNFPKNCMKLKEFGPPRGRASLAPPLRSANG